MAIVLDAQENISTINPRSISDIQLIEEFRKYRNYNKGKVSYELMSIDMGYSKHYLHSIMYNVAKKHKSLQFETKERLVHYLAKRKHFHISGLPKDLGKPLGTKEERGPREIRTYFDVTDEELIEAINAYKSKAGISIRKMAKQSTMGVGTLAALLKGRRKRVYTNNKKRLFNYLYQKNWFDQQGTNHILQSAVEKSVERIREAKPLTDLDKMYMASAILSLPLEEERKLKMLASLPFKLKFEASI
jgi:hypothetical protein